MAFEYQAEARWKQNVAVLGSFAPIDENFAGVEVDIPDLDVDEFVHAYSGIEEQFEQDLVLHIAALLGTISYVSSRPLNSRRQPPRISSAGSIPIQSNTGCITP